MGLATPAALLSLAGHAVAAHLLAVSLAGVAGLAALWALVSYRAGRAYYGGVDHD